jgi:hypothetical protein
MRWYRLAVAAYARENGELPYSAAGQDAALYKLRDYLEFQYIPAELSESLVFDDTRRRLDNNPFLYLNRPGVSFADLPPRLVILVEKENGTGGGGWYFRADGFVGYARFGRRGGREAVDIVGSEYGPEVPCTEVGDNGSGPISPSGELDRPGQ